VSQEPPFAKARLLPALAQARIARVYSAEALDSDPEVQRLRAEGHLVVAVPGVRIVIYRRSREGSRPRSPAEVARRRGEDQARCDQRSSAVVWDGDPGRYNRGEPPRPVISRPVRLTSLQSVWVSVTRSCGPGLCIDPCNRWMGF